MPINGIPQPELIEIDSCLRLRKYCDDCCFALSWYQDEETLMLVDGVNHPYDLDRLYRMYHYLRDRGEVYFIELRQDGGSFEPIGDVTFWQEDMPIVIGRKELRGQGIGRRVISALVDRARQLGFSSLKVSEVYDYNIGSRRMFESVGFQVSGKTENGNSFTLKL